MLPCVKTLLRPLKDNPQVWGPYSLDLMFEAASFWSEISDAFDDIFPVLDGVAEKRGYPEVLDYMPPFTWFCYRWAHARGRLEDIKAPFVQHAEKQRRTAPRSSEGAVLHPGSDGDGMLLIDGLQSYAATMSQAGSLSGDATFFQEAADQYRIHRDILRDPRTGLWSQGRGWSQDPDALSPGAWSRGQGWLMRGLAECMLHIPRESEYWNKMVEILSELAHDLAALRDDEGLWHALLHLPHDRSPAESSGSALLNGAIGQAVALGILPADPWADRVRKTAEALQRRITPNGATRGACKGPGPLSEENLPTYLDVKGFPPGDPHGPGCFLYGLAGAYLIDNKTSIEKVRSG